VKKVSDYIVNTKIFVHLTAAFCAKRCGKL